MLVDVFFFSRRNFLWLLYFFFLPNYKNGTRFASLSIVKEIKRYSSLTAKRLRKGTSEAPVLPESKHRRRSKGISLRGEGKRTRFPSQLFAVPFMPAKTLRCLLT